jgi:hypothetical protein
LGGLDASVIAVLGIKNDKKISTYRALIDFPELNSAKLLCLTGVPALMEDKDFLCKRRILIDVRKFMLVSVEASRSINVNK